MKTVVQYIDGEYPMFVFDNGVVAPCGEWGKDVLNELNALRKIAQIAQDGMRHISMSAEREYNYSERIDKLLNSIT